MVAASGSGEIYEDAVFVGSLEMVAFDCCGVARAVRNGEGCALGHYKILVIVVSLFQHEGPFVATAFGVVGEFPFRDDASRGPFAAEVDIGIVEGLGDVEGEVGDHVFRFRSIVLVVGVADDVDAVLVFRCQVIAADFVGRNGGMDVGVEPSYRFYVEPGVACGEDFEFPVFVSGREYECALVVPSKVSECGGCGRCTDDGIVPPAVLQDGGEDILAAIAYGERGAVYTEGYLLVAVVVVSFRVGGYTAFYCDSILRHAKIDLSHGQRFVIVVQKDCDAVVPGNEGAYVGIGEPEAVVCIKCRDVLTFSVILDRNIGLRGLGIFAEEEVGRGPPQSVKMLKTVEKTVVVVGKFIETDLKVFIAAECDDGQRVEVSVYLGAQCGNGAENPCLLCPGTGG